MSRALWPGSPAPGEDVPGEDAPGEDAPGGGLPGVRPLRAGEEPPHVLYVRFDAPVGEYPELLGLLADVTPVTQALPPDAALLDVRGALRYFGQDAAGLGRLIRCRALARHGSDCVIGASVNPLLARMAADAGGPGAVRVVRAGEAAEFLADKPVAALHGVGPATARILVAYGLDSVGRLAAAPPGTVQRVLGAALGRRLVARARGVDPTPVVPSAPARSVGSEHRFDRDELDPERRHRALLALADGLGFRMRTEGQVARVLHLTVRYADRSSTVRSRTLAEPTAHTPVLAATAYALHDALGLQRARVRSVGLRAEELIPVEEAVLQLSLDPRAEKARRAEAAADRARVRFGPAAAYPAGALEAA
ncbi:hypothetical protein E0L36_06585 [Streptomyces sp. AJS327]|uniref:DNA polymerase Y family protein n=1 Tax=Streptomyces sp. AJS327 TaxID=2545265 RepID=UPI0015DF2854|nr:hypothetical protein [Streptomyces sp. AJS327]MBA0050575.1 hypothetical protein [Streptomyces sp. AJS327]